MTDNLLDDEPSTPAEMASVLAEAAELLDGVLDSMSDAAHRWTGARDVRLDVLGDAHERVRQAWADVTVARTALTNLGMRETLHRITGLTE